MKNPESPTPAYGRRLARRNRNGGIPDVIVDGETGYLCPDRATTRWGPEHPLNPEA